MRPAASGGAAGARSARGTRRGPPGGPRPIIPASSQLQAMNLATCSVDGRPTRLMPRPLHRRAVSHASSHTLRSLRPRLPAPSIPLAVPLAAWPRETVPERWAQTSVVDRAGQPTLRIARTLVTGHPLCEGWAEAPALEHRRQPPRPAAGQGQGDRSCPAMKRHPVGRGSGCRRAHAPGAASGPGLARLSSRLVSPWAMPSTRSRVAPDPGRARTRARGPSDRRRRSAPAELACARRSCARGKVGTDHAPA